MNRRPEAITGPAERSRAVWPSLLVVTLVIGIGSSMAQTTEPVRTKPTALPTASNPAGAVPLGAFVDRETLRWQSAPRGTQVWDGVTFVCKGALRTAGMRAARDGKGYPGAVLGIPVNHRGARIHLLQAAENAEEMTDGVPYGRMVLRYANGDSRRFDLLLGVHGEDWLQPKAVPNEPVADPNSRLAWLQTRTGDGRTVRLYHSAIANPIPLVNITTVDFISPLTEANLLVFGLTVDDDARPLAPSHGPGEAIGDAPVFDTITFMLQDGAGRAAPRASLAWIAAAPGARIQFPPFAADSQGQVRIEVPRRRVWEIQYEASGPDGGTAAGSLETDTAGVFPPKPVVRLSTP